MNDNIENDMENVKSALIMASEFGLEVEVIYFAMRHLRDNKESSIGEALNYGLDEWIK